MSDKSSTEDLSQIPMADDEVDSDDVLERNNLTESSTPRSVPGLKTKLLKILTRISFSLLFVILQTSFNPVFLSHPQCRCLTQTKPR